MIKNLIPLCICLILVACSNENNAVPKNILPVRKMAQVMVDVNLLEASLAQNINTGIKVDTTTASINFEIFKKHSITKQQFQESFDYYTLHADSVDRIYELVLIDLSKMQAEVMNKKEATRLKTSKDIN